MSAVQDLLALLLSGENIREARSPRPRVDTKAILTHTLTPQHHFNILYMTGLFHVHEKTPISLYHDGNIPEDSGRRLGPRCVCLTVNGLHLYSALLPVAALQYRLTFALRRKSHLAEDFP